MQKRWIVKNDDAAKADTIIARGSNLKIFGGVGKDSLNMFGTVQTLSGGKGADTFYYRTGDGNDTIFGYEATVDKIILASGSISNVTADRNNNVIFTVDEGQIVVNNAVNRTVKIVDSSGKIVDNGLYEP